MAQIYLLGEAADLGLGDVSVPHTSTPAQVRALERQLMTQQAKPATGFFSQVAQSMDSSASRINKMGDQIVSAIDAATRLKLATKAAKARVQTSLTTYQYPYPVVELPWTEGEWIPGFKNLHVVVALGCLLGAVALMRRS